MRAGPAFFALASAAPVVTWNPSDKHADITLSGLNLIATKTAGDALRSVRATHGKAHTANGYFEVLVGGTAFGSFRLVGVSTTSMPVSIGCGQDTNSWSYYQETGAKVTNGVTTAFGATWASGDVIQVAFSNGKIWFGKNGTYQGSGNPAAGTNEAFSGIAGTVFPTASPYAGATAPQHTMTGRFRSADFSFAPPAGFSAWE